MRWLLELFTNLMNRLRVFLLLFFLGIFLWNNLPFNTIHNHCYFFKSIYFSNYLYLEAFLVLSFYVKSTPSPFHYYYIVGRHKYVYIKFFKSAIKTIYAWCAVDLFCLHNSRTSTRYEEAYASPNLHASIVSKRVMFPRRVVKCLVKHSAVWITSDYQQLILLTLNQIVQRMNTYMII